MKIGKAGLDIVELYEQGPEGGPALEAYICPAGKPTIGWGHTKDVYYGMHATREQCERFLREDMADAELAVNAYAHVPVTQHQFDALVCLVFNIGSGAFRDSTLLRKLNAGDYTGAANEFPKWNKSRGTVLNGLVMRRADEKALFMTGIGV